MRTFFLVLLLAAGCGPRPHPLADPGQAREALRTALDTWQRGSPPDALAAVAPPVHVRDRDWSAGCRLTGYQLAGDGDRAGIELCYRVTLTLRDPTGKVVRKDTTYLVGTSPVVTVVRHDSDS
jgi:hypothetical protein